jgi:hypothetical protein
VPLRYEHLEAIEKHVGKLAVLIAVMVAIGGTTRYGSRAATSTCARPATSAIRR